MAFEAVPPELMQPASAIAASRRGIVNLGAVMIMVFFCRSR
jgi:hypothetical protein